MAEPYPNRQSWQIVQASADTFRPLKTLVSIDHDFFYPPFDFENHPEAERLASAGSWSLEEWFSKERAAKIWQDHAERYEMLGQDPHKTTIPFLDQDVFLKKLFEHYNFDKGAYHIGDSHAWGLWSLISAAKAAGPVELIHFDAHHDCGYHNYRGDSWEKIRRRAWANPSCDDWVQTALRRGLIDRVTLIYPDWRGLEEWDNLHPPMLRAEEQMRIQVFTYSEWQSQHSGPARDAHLLFVRSSAFVPPWGETDQHFLEMAKKLGKYKCLDCMPNGLSYGDQNACQIRPNAKASDQD